MNQKIDKNKIAKYSYECKFVLYRKKMSSIIHILPEHLANKIAAGEVVQRPESVIKELLENSLDANATSISIHIKEGGKTLIHITDNGKGMSEEDAVLAFHRHATSKISSYEDLENIHTFGFRGEALASIASVSQVELKTRREEDSVGTLIRIDGGKIIEQEKIGTPVGTSITIKNLFYNTPARRHFLKSNATEFKHIYDCVQRTALSHPERAFEFISNDDTIINVEQNTLEERLKNIFGERHFETLIPINEKTELLSVSGYIGKPDFARKSKVDQYLFLNNRFIVNRSINHAIFSGYEHLVEKGNFPFFLLMLEIDPRKVDVNVHPSKLEVKFSDEQNIYRVVMAAIRKTLSVNDVVPSLQMNESETPSTASLQHSSLPRFFSKNVGMDENSFPKKNYTENVYSPIKNFPFTESVVKKSQENIFPSQTTSQQTENVSAENLPQSTKKLWQIHNKYIFTLTENGVMIVDQHAAHERILYEKALSDFEKAKPTTQQLLFSQTLEFTPGDFVLVQQLLPELQLLGFEIKIFGKNTVMLEGVPPDVKAGSENKIVQDIIDEFKTNQNKLKLDARDNVAKSFACKAAIKTGDVLTEKKMSALLEQLFSAKTPSVCPHGRPVVVKIPLAELDKRFMRT